MTKYIDRDAVEQLLRYAAALEKQGKKPVSATDILGDFFRIPTADVRENIVGKWIAYQQDRWIYAKCSSCETVHDVESNFCPNCGAKMMRGNGNG